MSMTKIGISIESKSATMSASPAWFDLKVRVTVRERDCWTGSSPMRLNRAQEPAAETCFINVFFAAKTKFYHAMLIPGS